MKKIISSLIIIASLQVVYGQSGWFQQVSGTTLKLVSIHFVDPNSGWTVGNGATYPPGGGIILNTTNGGLNWLNNNNYDLAEFTSIFFIDQNTGVAVSNRTFYLNGRIFTTMNGGSTWSVQGDNDFYMSVTFVNNDTGWIVGSKVGESFLVLKTTNRGASWFQQQVGYGTLFQAFYSCSFVDNSTGWAVGTGGAIQRTTNGGLNWVQQFSGTNIQLRCVRFVNPNIGWVIGWSPGILLKTSNGGMNWYVQDAGTNNVYSAYFLNQDTGWICGSGGTILKTTNGGINYHTQISGTAEFLDAVFFVNESTGWISGTGGIILKTITGGNTTGIEPINSGIPISYSLHQNYPNPFNPITHLRFEIPELRFVKLIVYDLLGREVAMLVNEQLTPGTYEVEWNGSNYASGVYFYSLFTSEFIQTKKLILLK